MTGNPFVPQYLVGRQAELHQVSQILLSDGDLLLAGVPGSGRHTLLRSAAQQIGARVLEIDCLRVTNASRFLELLAEGLLEVFSAPAELALIGNWCEGKPLTLEQLPARPSRLIWQSVPNEEWMLFQTLLSLPQSIAESLDCRVVLVFQNFSHIRSWDRSGKWEAYLEQEIQRQTRVSYALIATVLEEWAVPLKLQVITLGPLALEDFQFWLVNQMAMQGMKFDVDGLGLTLFHSYVEGHLGGAIALARRIWLTAKDESFPHRGLIQPHHVYRAAEELVEDLSVTFESLILLLPPSQVRVLESLALDPTDSPHARDYIQKHQLSRGGGLQGALAGLEQKGLVYGAKYGYRIALPLLAFWLKQRLA